MNDKIIYFHSKKRDNRENTIKVLPTIYKKIIPDQLNIENFGFMIQKFKDYQVRTQYLQLIKKNKEQEVF